MKNLAVLISGSGTNLQALLDACKSGDINAQVKLVISSNENAYGLTRAKSFNVDTYVCKKSDFKDLESRDERILQLLDNYKTDLVILAGYLGILTPLLVQRYNKKIINIHPALLPDYGGKGYYGINVHRAVIAAKEPFSGATTHYVDEGTDTGEIILQKKCKVLQGDTPEILQARILNQIEGKLLVETVKRLVN